MASISQDFPFPFSYMQMTLPWQIAHAGNALGLREMGESVPYDFQSEEV
jgi:hypothetical protein